MKPFSPTSLDSFDACPARYFRGLDLPPLVSAPLEAGSAVHEVTKQSGAPWPADKLAENAEMILSSLSEEGQSYFREMLPIKITVNPDGAEVYSEVKLAVDKDRKPVPFESDQAYFRGIVDAYWFQGSHLQVVDWKTNRRMPAESEVQMMRQPASYPLLILPILPHPPKFCVVELHFVRYGQSRQAVVGEREMDLAWKWIQRKTEERARMDPGHPEYRTGSHCQYCGFKGDCPEIDKLVAAGAISRIETQAQATEMANVMRAYLKFVEELKETLRAYGDIHGDIPTGDGEVLGYETREKVTYPETYKTLETLLKYGASMEELYGNLNLTKTYISKFKAVLTQESARREIGALSQSKKYSEFKFHKKGEVWEE